MAIVFEQIKIYSIYIYIYIYIFYHQRTKISCVIGETKAKIFATIIN